MGNSTTTDKYSDKSATEYHSEYLNNSYSGKRTLPITTAVIPKEIPPKKQDSFVDLPPKELPPPVDLDLKRALEKNSRLTDTRKIDEPPVPKETPKELGQKEKEKDKPKKDPSYTGEVDLQLIMGVIQSFSTQMETFQKMIVESRDAQSAEIKKDVDKLRTEVQQINQTIPRRDVPKSYLPKNIHLYWIQEGVSYKYSTKRIQSFAREAADQITETMTKMFGSFAKEVEFSAIDSVVDDTDGCQPIILRLCVSTKRDDRLACDEKERVIRRKYFSFRPWSFLVDVSGGVTDKVAWKNMTVEGNSTKLIEEPSAFIEFEESIKKMVRKETHSRNQEKYEKEQGKIIQDMQCKFEGMETKLTEFETRQSDVLSEMRKEVSAIPSQVLNLLNTDFIPVEKESKSEKSPRGMEGSMGVSPTISPRYPQNQIPESQKKDDKSNSFNLPVPSQREIPPLPLVPVKKFSKPSPPTFTIVCPRYEDDPAENPLILNLKSLLVHFLPGDVMINISKKIAPGHCLFLYRDDARPDKQAREIEMKSWYEIAARENVHITWMSLTSVLSMPNAIYFGRVSSRDSFGDLILSDVILQKENNIGFKSLGEFVCEDSVTIVCPDIENPSEYPLICEIQELMCKELECKVGIESEIKWGRNLMLFKENTFHGRWMDVEKENTYSPSVISKCMFLTESPSVINGLLYESIEFDGISVNCLIGDVNPKLMEIIKEFKK